MVRYSKKHSMDPSIMSKTTILFDVTTILLSLLQQLLCCNNDLNVHDRSCCTFIWNCNSFFKHECQKMTFKILVVQQ
jgi:hypothetical protein